MQTTGGAVGAAAELPAGMELGVDELDSGQTRGGFDIHGHPAAGVAHLDGAVVVNGDVDTIPVALQRFVDAVVDDLPHAVHEAPLIGGADVHAGTLAHRLEPLQDGEVTG